MKKIVFISLLSFICSIGLTHSQSGSAKQVKWTSTVKKTGDKQYELKLTASISGDFHMYAQEAGVEGPVPTTISFTANPLLIIDGKAVETGKKITKVEKAWDGKVNYYEKTVTFTQKIKAKTKAKTNIIGKVEFMVCNDEVCLPPSEYAFKVLVGQ
jgi:thiol:disulfide interchange protein DsbD